MEKSACIRVYADRRQIDQCRKTLNENASTFQSLGKVLELAGNEIRLKILFLLEEQNELCPCDLRDILGISIPAVSQHLRKMKDGNIVQTRRSAQTIFYSLKEEHHKILKPFFKHINKGDLKSEKV